MKNIKYVVAAIALSTLSFGAFAAEPVTSTQAQSMNKVGVVSADGASTLDGTEPNWLKKRPLQVQVATALRPLSAKTK